MEFKFAAAREQAEQFQQALSDMFNRSQTSQDSLGNSFAQRTDLMQQNLSAVTTVLNETLTSIQTDQQSRANIQTPAMSKSHPTRPPPRPKHDFSQIPAVDSTVSDPTQYVSNGPQGQASQCMNGDRAVRCAGLTDTPGYGCVSQ